METSSRGILIRSYQVLPDFPDIIPAAEGKFLHISVVGRTYPVDVVSRQGLPRGFSLPRQLIMFLAEKQD